MIITSKGCDLKVGQMFQEGDGKWYEIVRIDKSMMDGYLDYVCKKVKILNDIEKSTDENYLNAMMKNELKYIQSVTKRRMIQLGLINWSKFKKEE